MGRRTRQRQRSTRVQLDPRAEVEKLVAAEVAKLVPSVVQGNRSDQPQIDRRPMTLLEAIGAGTGGMPVGFIPFQRDPRDNNAFGPGNPLLPDPVDAPDPTNGQPLPRVFEYDVSWNLPGNGQREVPWQVLRIASTAVDIIRRCIEYRKRTLRGLKPRWVVSAEAIQAAYESSPDAGRESAEQTLRAKYADTIKALTQWWREPWRQNGLDFGQWLNMLMEEHLVLDAVAVYPRRALSGDVLDFQILDGSTIKPLLDVQGARPSSPYAAFQQILYGFPRGEYGAAVDADGKPKAGYSTAQLFYHRENVRANSPYGLSPVEQALIAARLYLKRQGWMLAEYDDGSTPVTWVIPSEDEQQKSGQAFTPAIRRAWEDGVNEELGGSTRRRHRAKVLPPGWQAIQTQSVDERYKPDYDLHLIKLLCGFFNVPITELGFSEAKGIGNSGLHEGMADVSDKVGDRPDTEVIAGMITKLARQFQGCPVEVELTFVEPDSKETLEESQADDLKYKGGVLTLNDLRRKDGLPVYAFPEADMPILIGVGPTGVTFLEGLHDQQKAMQESQLALTNTQVGAGQAQIQQTEADMAAPAEQDAAKSAELGVFSRWQRRNPNPRRPFLFKACEPDDVDRLFELDPNTMAFEGWAWEADLDKGAGWDAGVKRFRDNRGRFVRGLKLDDALDHLDDVVSRLHAGKKVRKGEHPRTDALHAAGLLQDSPDRPGQLELSDAGRQHIMDRAPDDYAEQRGTPVLDQIEADGGTIESPTPEPTPDVHPNMSDEALMVPGWRRSRAIRNGEPVPPLREEESAPAPSLAPEALDTLRAVAGDPNARFDESLSGHLETTGHIRRRRGAGHARVASEFVLTDAGRRELAGGTIESPKVDEARARQARIDHARGLAEQFADVEEMIDNRNDPAEIARRIRSAADRNPGNADMAEFASTIEGHQGDVDAMRASARAWAAQHGMSPIGEVGQSVTFDPSQHHAPDWMRREMRAEGITEMDVVRPGYTWTDPVTGDQVRMHKPAVDFHDQEVNPAPAPVEHEAAVLLEDARGATLDDKIRRAEVMYGTDRSKWPAAVRAEETRIKMRAAAEAKRAERMRHTDTQQAQHIDLADRAPAAAPEPLPQVDASSSVQAMNSPKPIVAGETLAQTLRTAASREAAQRVIAHLTVPQLRALADEMGDVAYTKADTKQKLRDKIVYMAVGTRLDSDAIRGVDTRANLDAPPIHPAAPHERSDRRGAYRAGYTDRELDARDAKIMDAYRASAIEGRMQSATNIIGARRELEGLSRGELDSMVEHTRRGRSTPDMRDDEVRESLARAVRGRHPRRLNPGELSEDQQAMVRSYRTRMETLEGYRESLRTTWANSPNVQRLTRDRIRQEEQATRIIARDLEAAGVDVTTGQLISAEAPKPAPSVPKRDLAREIDEELNAHLTAVHPFGAHAEAPEMEPSDRNGERVTIRARDTEDYGTIVGRRGPQHAGAGNNFLVVRHDDGTYQSYDSRVVHAQSSATGLELADQARQAQTREAAMALAGHRGADETRSKDTVQWDMEAMGRLWDDRHNVAARRALRDRGEAITTDSLRAEVARQREVPKPAPTADLSAMSDAEIRALHAETFPSGGKANADQVATAPRAQLERSLREAAAGPPKPAPTADERQLAIQTANYQRLLTRADELDMQINLAESDEERRALEFDREALDKQMAALDRQIAAARQRSARRRR